jgi:hypothetical protein
VNPNPTTAPLGPLNPLSPYYIGRDSEAPVHPIEIPKEVGWVMLVGVALFLVFALADLNRRRPR